MEFSSHIVPQTVHWAVALAGPCLFADNNRNLCTLSWSPALKLSALYVCFIKCHHKLFTNPSLCAARHVVQPTHDHKVCAHILFAHRFSALSPSWPGTGTPHPCSVPTDNPPGGGGSSPAYLEPSRYDRIYFSSFIVTYHRTQFSFSLNLFDFSK